MFLINFAQNNQNLCTRMLTSSQRDRTKTRIGCASAASALGWPSRPISAPKGARHRVRVRLPTWRHPTGTTTSRGGGRTRRSRLFYGLALLGTWECVYVYGNKANRRISRAPEISETIPTDRGRCLGGFRSKARLPMDSQVCGCEYRPPRCPESDEKSSRRKVHRVTNIWVGRQKISVWSKRIHSPFLRRVCT